MATPNVDEIYKCVDFFYDFNPPLGDFQYYYLRPVWTDQQPVKINHVGMWMEV
jgi:hypothetical protein